MTTPTYTPADIVNLAVAKDGVNLATAFDQLVGQRVVDAIQAKRQEIASAMFNEPEAGEEQEAEQEEQQPEGDAGETEQPEQEESEESDENTQSTD